MIETKLQKSKIGNKLQELLMRIELDDYLKILNPKRPN